MAHHSKETELRTAGVDLEGLMQVLSKHLYSTPMVALRELVQNGHDSIIRRQLETHNSDFDRRITVLGFPEKQQLKIIDTGAGLTHDEIHSFLATVGVGYTRTLRREDDETGLIGMFGLGFLSAFVLADEVIFATTSYQTPEEGWVYRSKNAEHYFVESMAPRAIGSEITLHLKEEYAFLAQAEVLDRVLGRYCILLREPIFINQSQTAINEKRPPWERDPAVVLHPAQKLRQDLEFAKRFEPVFEPIATMTVAPDEHSDAIGLLWVQDGATYGTSDNRHLSIFLRGMLLDDDARDLLPTWAGFIGGVIESQKLVPTASREDLQKDAHYDAIRYALSEAIIAGLAEIAEKQPEAWRRILTRHNEALLGASLCDERLFSILKDHLRIPTSQGELLLKDLRVDGTLYVMLGSNGGFEDTLFRALKVPVAFGDRYAVVPFLRRVAQAGRGRLIEIGTDKGNEKLFTTAKLTAEVQTWVLEHIGDGEQIIAARFMPEELPLVVVIDREMELKKRLEADEADKKMSQAALRLARLFTQRIESGSDQKLYLNLNNSAVKQLLEAIESNPVQAERAAPLLKALKVLMSGRDQSQSLNLNEALNVYTQTLNQLLTSKS